MSTSSRILATALVTGALAGAAGAEPVRNVVLVHGAFADGSGWRGVYDELTTRGFAVSWYVVATEDGAIAPELLRRTARRIGAKTTEIPGSHVVFLTQPRAVADVIQTAALGVPEAGREGAAALPVVE